MEKEKILIIEDDEDTRMYLEFFIGKSFQIFIYNSSDFFNKFNDSLSCDLIVLDVSIKNQVNSDVLIKKIKTSRSLKNLPLICLSAQTSEHVRERALELGADEFLIKPVANNKLLKILEEYLSSKASG